MRLWDVHPPTSGCCPECLRDPTSRCRQKCFRDPLITSCPGFTLWRPLEFQSPDSEEWGYEMYFANTKKNSQMYLVSGDSFLSLEPEPILPWGSCVLCPLSKCWSYGCVTITGLASPCVPYEEALGICKLCELLCKWAFAFLTTWIRLFSVASLCLLFTGMLS